MLSRSKLYQPSDRDRERARRGAIAWAKSVVADDTAVFLDTETTGLDETAEIIEISVLDAHGNALLDSLVRPIRRIPPDAQAIHGISNEMVASAAEWREIFPYLAEIFNSRRVIVYNAGFDLRMVQQMNRQHRIAHRVSPWQCAMLQYSEYAGIWNAKYGNYRYHKLDNAVAAFGHAPGGHRARSDALACKLVVEGMAGG